MTSSATTKFQSALPLALLSISPSLSALHASRARSLNPENFDSSPPMYCLQCGSYLLASDGSLELYRPRKRRKIAKKKSNSLKCTCHRCGFISYTSIDRKESVEPTTGGKLSLIPPESYTSSPSHPKPGERPLPSSSRSSTSANSSPVKHSTPLGTPALHIKPKKKTMLHEMLVHNRKKEIGRTKTQQSTSQSGLAAFLSSL